MNKKHLSLFISCWMVLLASSVVLADHHGKKKVGWVKIFDGKTLKGWTQRNGTATYRVEDGAIVGKTNEGSPNSFLCSNKEYSNFELKFEVKVDNRLNSGVQIRSNTKGGPRGRVNGPQVEIEASGKKGAESGYIYGEAAGGWMTPKNKLIPHKHFKDGEWNKYKVLALGPRFMVWINGHLISDLVDYKKFETHPKGFIGLQVHGIRKGTGPYEVAWKNIEVREIPTKDKKWVSLFNGKDLKSWQKTSGNWLIEKGGVLKIQPRKGEKGWQRYGDYIYTKKKYKDFILDMEYSYPEKGNSGIYFRIGDTKDPVKTGIESQILDSSKKGDKLTAHDHGGIISTVAAKKNMSKKPGEWNHITITCIGSHLHVFLNGEPIVDIDLSKTPVKDRPLEGYIGLQDHGVPNNISFKNIRIMEI